MFDLISFKIRFFKTLGFVYSLQEGATSLRHDLSSNDLNNNDNEFEEDASELGDRLVNSSSGFNESMNATYQHQAKKKQVGLIILNKHVKLDASHQ